MNYGVQLGIDPADVQARAEDGTMMSEARATSRSLQFSLDAMTESDRAAFFTHASALGLAKDFLISGHPADASADREHQYMMMAKFAGSSSISMPNSVAFTAQVSVKEA